MLFFWMRCPVLAAFDAAVQRGAEIDVFADPLLNLGLAADGLTHMEAVEKAFSRIGARLHKLPKLHSKIVAIDTANTRAMRRYSFTEGGIWRKRSAPSLVAFGVETRNR